MNRLRDIDFSEILEVAAHVILRQSKLNTPVDTGNLRNSQYIDNQGDKVYLVVNAKYAAYVEYGTEKMAAKPYLRPAIEGTKDEFLRVMKEEIEKRLA